MSDGIQIEMMIIANLMVLNVLIVGFHFNFLVRKVISQMLSFFAFFCLCFGGALIYILYSYYKL